jgi:hypothetical protein
MRTVDPIRTLCLSRHVFPKSVNAAARISCIVRMNSMPCLVKLLLVDYEREH